MNSSFDARKKSKAKLFVHILIVPCILYIKNKTKNLTYLFNKEKALCTGQFLSKFLKEKK